MGDWLWLHMLYLETLSLFKLIVVENVIGFRASRGPRKQTPLQPAGQAWSPKRTYLSCPHPYPSREYGTAAKTTSRRLSYSWSFYKRN
jgi:hypothetical protein